jgi:hypothetical protein
MQKVIIKFFFSHFLGSKQQDCQENDSIVIDKVGARTTIICQSEKDDGNKENENENPDKSTTVTNIANNDEKGECPNVNLKSYTQKYPSTKDLYQVQEYGNSSFSRTFNCV